MTKIEEIRIAKGFSRYRLSKITGLSYITISAIENGGDVRLSSLSKIAKALDVKVSELIKEDV